MTDKILTVEQLDELDRLGIVHKDSDNCYYPLINKEKWGGACMPSGMVEDLAGTEHNFVRNPYAPAYYNSKTVVNWSVCEWMLDKNFATLKTYGKFIPEICSDGKYRLHILSLSKLDELTEMGILNKHSYGENDYTYIPRIEGVGENSMPDSMVAQLAGRTVECEGYGSLLTWTDTETEHRWGISQWMLEENYAYLKSRALGELTLPGDDEEDDDDDDEEEEEEEIPDWCEASIVGVIEETNPAYITINCSEMSVPVLCYGDAESHGIGERVKVRGKLIRVQNMMGYPEIDITYIEEY